jgi:hypothetical protein
MQESVLTVQAKAQFPTSRAHGLDALQQEPGAGKCDSLMPKTPKKEYRVPDNKPISDSYAIYGAYTDQVKKIYGDFSEMMVGANGDATKEQHVKDNFVSQINLARRGRDIALSVLPADPNPAK